jgi:zinc transport system permease protein
MDDFLGFLSLIKWGLLACLFFALSAGLTSPFILLNRNALLPHALTHILLLPLLVISLLFPNLDEFFLIPLAVALTLILSLFIWFLERMLFIFEDSASAIVIHLSLALALVLAVKGSQYDYRLLSYLFGDILLATEQTFFISFVIFILTLLFFLKHRYSLLISALGWEFPGINTARLNLIFLLFLCLQVVLGAKILGVLLVSAFYNFSGLVALKLSPSFRKTPLLLLSLNLASVPGGATLSYLFDIPFSAGAIIFMSLYLFFMTLKGR